jgi:formylglycine-generating enzyme required for sulfatase activity
MPPRDYLLLLGVAAGALSMLVSNPVGVSFTGTVALFATVVTARAQETEERYGRTRMGPSVLTIEQETEKASKPGSEFTECASGCPAMIVVPAGSFRMGSPATEADRSPNEGPQHEVTIAKPFAVGRTEVTFAQWDSCVAAGACRKLGDNAWGRGDRPVINVGWSEAAYHQLAQRYPLRRAVWLSPEFHWAPWRLAMQGSARW